MEGTRATVRRFAVGLALALMGIATVGSVPASAHGRRGGAIRPGFSTGPSYVIPNYPTVFGPRPVTIINTWPHVIVPRPIIVRPGAPIIVRPGAPVHPHGIVVPPGSTVIIVRPGVMHPGIGGIPIRRLAPGEAIIFRPW